MVSTRAIDLVKDRLAKVLEGTAKMYKIILLDYSMPDLDGIQLVRELRSMIKEKGLK